MVPHNMTWIKYPSLSKDSSTNFEDIIFSQEVISRFMHAYMAFLVPTGLLAGILIVGICIRNYRSHTLEKLDVLFFSQTVSNIFLILLSLTVAVRPAYLRLSYITCGTLSFFFNLGYFCSQYLLIVMALSLFLSRHPPQNAFVTKACRNPKMCVGFVLMCSSCAALTLSALLGIENYHEETDCQLDPLFAWPEYEMIKFTFGFCAPSLAGLLCFILAFVKKSHPPRKNSHFLSTVLVSGATTLVARLFYNIMILSRTSLKIKGDRGTPQNELIMNIAEVVLFSEICVNLVVLLCLHHPYRTALLNSLKNLTRVCRRRESSRALEIQETPAGPSEIRSH